MRFNHEARAIAKPTQHDYAARMARHRAYFLAGNTRGVAWRKTQLTALAAQNAVDLKAALWTDLRPNWVVVQANPPSARLPLQLLYPFPYPDFHLKLQHLQQSWF